VALADDPGVNPPAWREAGIMNRSQSSGRGVAAFAIGAAFAAQPVSNGEIEATAG